MKRLFAAIKVEPDENLIRIYSELKKNLHHEKINWVPEQNIHVTLKFFGETSEDRVDEICSVLHDAALRHRLIEFSLQNIGIFGSSYDPRVIWFGMSECKALEMLANDILDSVAGIGFEIDRQNFRPHLTVGRIKQLKDKRFFQQVISNYKTTYLQQVHVEKIFLFESKLRPQGPVYEIVEEFNLQ